MQNKLQELTNKIYKEGLEKGNEEASVIVNKATEEAKQIVDEAKKKADKLIEDAEKKALELQTNTESEIKLTSRQAVNALKQQITNVINDKLVSEAISKSFDKDFIKKIIESTLKNWSSSQVADLNILLPEKEQKELNEYFAKSLKTFLDKGLTISFSKKIEAGFQIVPKDGSYKLSFTDNDFENFFKQYLRPKLTGLLFQD